LTSNDQFDFTYTANGELATKTDKTTQDLTTYQYDAFGNLLSVDLPNTTEITYKADGRGRRVAKDVDGVLDQQLIYGSQLQVVAEIAADGTFTRFVYSGKQNVPDYAVRDGVFYRVITDHLGSLRMVVRASDGAVMESRSYDAWGNVSEVASGFHPLPFGFAGGLQDADTGLVRFGARDYDPSVGRWVAKDPIRFFGGDQNLMAYAGNEPVNRTDPRGLDWAQDLWDWGSAAARAAGGALSQLGGWGAAGVEVGVGAGSVLICGAVFMSDSSTKDLDPPRAPGDPEYCARVKDHCVDACLGELPGEWPFAQCMRDCMASYQTGMFAYRLTVDPDPDAEPAGPGLPVPGKQQFIVVNYYVQ